MAWRIARWQGTTKVSEYMIALRVSRQEMSRMLVQLAAEHMSTDREVTIRSNRRGTMLWTTEKGQHFTATHLPGFARSSGSRER